MRYNVEERMDECIAAAERQSGVHHAERVRVMVRLKDSMVAITLSDSGEFMASDLPDGWEFKKANTNGDRPFLWFVDNHLRADEGESA